MKLYIKKRIPAPTQSRVRWNSNDSFRQYADDWALVYDLEKGVRYCDFYSYWDARTTLKRWPMLSEEDKRYTEANIRAYVKERPYDNGEKLRQVQWQ